MATSSTPPRKPRTVLAGASVNIDTLSRHPNAERLGNLAERRQLGWSVFWQAFRTGATFLLADIFAVLLASFIASACVTLLFTDASYRLIFSETSAAIAAQVVAGFLLGSYPGIFLNPIQELRKQCIKIILAWSAVLGMASLFATLHPFEALAIGAGMTANLFLAPACRGLVRHYCRNQSWWGQNVIIVGASEQGFSLYHFLDQTPELGLKVAGIVDEAYLFWNYSHREEDVHLGTMDDLDQIVREYKVSWVIRTTHGLGEGEMASFLEQVVELPHVVLISPHTMLPSLWVESRECGGMAGIYLQDQLARPLLRIMKRTFDFLASLCGILALLPFLPVVALWIKLSSQGPVFYGHTRVGHRNTRFQAWKFRTMVQDADEQLRLYLENNPEARAEWEKDRKLKHDPRIIPGIGHFLRKSSLDELPQLWNVLIGQMSLVGPRPIQENEIVKYEGAFRMYQMVPPGITGLWQVSGRNNTSYRERVQLDTYYVRNWSIWIDLYILVRTIRTVFFQEGAY